MTTFLTAVVLTLSQAVFPYWVDRTGDPVFFVREKAQRVLTACWPLSDAALAAGCVAADPEVRERCRRVRAAALRSGRVYFSKPDFVAGVLLTHPSERDGLPLADYRLAPADRYAKDSHGESYIEPGRLFGVGRDELRLAVIRVAKALGQDTTDQWFFSPYNFYSEPTGYDCVRIRMRGVRFGGVADWTEYRDRLRAEWAGLKSRPAGRDDNPWVGSTRR